MTTCSSIVRAIYGEFNRGSLDVETKAHPSVGAVASVFRPILFGVTAGLLSASAVAPEGGGSIYANGTENSWWARCRRQGRIS